METNNNIKDNIKEVKSLPWGIKILLFLAGQIGAIFVLGAMAGTLFAMIDNLGAVAFLGKVLLCACFITGRVVKDEKIIYAVCLPAYMDGILLLCVGLYDMPIPFIVFINMVVALISFAAVPNHYFRSLMILACFGLFPALFSTVDEMHVMLCGIGFFYIVIYILTCVYQEKLKKEVEIVADSLSAVRFSAILVGFVLTFFNDIVVDGFRHYSTYDSVYAYDGIYNVDLLSIVYAVTALAFAVYFISKYMGKLAPVPVLMCVVVFALSSFYRPIVLSMLCAMVGFWVKDRRGWILSLVLLIGSTIFYYYNTNITLLQKSISLMVIGVVLLLCVYYVIILCKKSEAVSESVTPKSNENE